MQTRFLQVVYWLSVAWLGLITYGWLFGTASISFSDFVLNVLVLGWPSLLGFLLCFMVGGRFLLPPRQRDSSTKS
jgi:hypothetical protein